MHFLRFLFLFFSLCFINTSAFNQENYNLTLRSNLPFTGISLANISGYADAKGNEYALVGTSLGLSIVDVTDPDKPILRFNVNGVKSGWREIKTWQGYAYVTSEGSNSGLTILDMRQLPDTIFSKVYRGDGTIANNLSSNHALHIENGFCYLYGTNSSGPVSISNGGIAVLDLKDPWNPKFVGKYNQDYVHDGYVHNDTVWACNILKGKFSVINFKNKANPIVLAQQTTPTGLTHNSWLTDNRKTLLVTEETTNSFLTSWDISDLSNIKEADRFQTAPGSNSTVHNTHILNDFAITSWYTEGVVIVDAARPQNLVEVAKNDFTPLEGEGTHGCWGVYPFLPSGNIVASDMERGLYVLSPNYVRASYLEGTIRDSICGNLLENVTVTISGTDRKDITGLDGIFRTGIPKAGPYDITFSKAGYPIKTIKNVLLESGKVRELNIKLFNPLNINISGKISDQNNLPIENAQVNIANSQTSYALKTDMNGTFSKCDLVPEKYDFTAGKWGYITYCEKQKALSQAEIINGTLKAGYYDDFQFNFGWKTSGNALSGFWTRAVPFGTIYNGSQSNPSIDAGGDCNSIALITGNIFSSTAGADDVDDGATIATSPIIDLTGYSNPYIHVYRWFYNGGGSGELNDTLYLKIKHDGISTTLKKISKSSMMSQWVKESFRMKDFIQQPGLVEFIAEAVDYDPGHILEAGLDMFLIIDSVQVVGEIDFSKSDDELVIMPNPSSGQTFIKYHFNHKLSNANLFIADLSGRMVTQFLIDKSQDMLPLDASIAPGIYIIGIMNEAGMFLQQKWVKN